MYAVLRKNPASRVEDEMESMNRIMPRIERLNLNYFPEYEYVSALWYENTTFRRQCQPAVIQNNYMIGNANKTKRAMEKGQLFLHYHT